MAPTTSDLGLEALKREEGVVLRAYRCPAGEWTIGPGLTAASGVIKPRAGMVITAAEADRLTKLALARNYEPRVAKAMPGAAQHEFDAGVMFDWNTGAIKRASWVPLWVQKAARPMIEAKFLVWNKGGGRVLPALKSRRKRELLILFEANYGAKIAPQSSSVTIARWALPMTVVEKAKVLAELHALGYRGGAADQFPAAEVRRFQKDHGLTQDGVIGRATLSTLQRRIDAAAKAKQAVVAAPTAGALSLPNDTGTALVDALSGVPHLAILALGAALAFSLWAGWTYRDVIAAKLAYRAPRLARILRSF